MSSFQLIKLRLPLSGNTWTKTLRVLHKQGLTTTRLFNNGNIFHQPASKYHNSTSQCYKVKSHRSQFNHLFGKTRFTHQFDQKLHIHPSTCLVSSSFHTTARACDDFKLKLPTEFTSFLQEKIDNHGDGSVVNNAEELQNRADYFFEEFVKFYRYTCSSSITVNRLRPLWYRDQVHLWGTLQDLKNYTYWEQYVVKDPKDTVVQKVAEVLQKLKHAPTNKKKFEHTHVEACKVKVLDIPRSLIGKEEGRDFGTCSYPIGTIYISKEFCLKHKSVNKLAFVLGRELARIYLNHEAERLAIRSACLMTSHHVFVNLKDSIDPGAVPREQGAVSHSEIYDALLTVTENFMERITTAACFPNSHQMERELDALGLTISAWASFNPQSAIKLIERGFPLESLARDNFQKLDHPIWTELHDEIFRIHRIRQSDMTPDKKIMVDEVNESCVWKYQYPGTELRLNNLTVNYNTLKDAQSIYDKATNKTTIY